MIDATKTILSFLRPYTIDDQKAILMEVQSAIEAEEKEQAVRTPLEAAWDSVQRDVAYLEHEPYIDDQYEIEEAWDTCEDLIGSGELKNENWTVRKRILKDIIENDLYNDYSLTDPMEDMLKALCFTPEEKIQCANMISGMRYTSLGKYAAELYRDNGQPEKYYYYLEHHLKGETVVYKELIDHYREEDPDKAVMIAETAMNDTWIDQTDALIFLLDVARENGDEERRKTKTWFEKHSW